MGLRKVVKKGFSSGFQPKRWLGLDHVKSNGKICADLAKGLFDNKTEKDPDAKRISQLTPVELENRKKLAVILGILYFAVGLSLIGYAFYLWLEKGFILQGFMCVILAFLVSINSLRELMVYGQIRSRRDRLTIKEWFRLLIKGFPK